MRRSARAVLGALVVVALAGWGQGCLLTTHTPQDMDPVHLGIDWRAGVDEAVRDARETQKPLLFVLAAGDITGPC